MISFQVSVLRNLNEMNGLVKMTLHPDVDLMPHDWNLKVVLNDPANVKLNFFWPLNYLVLPTYCIGLN